MRREYWCGHPLSTTFTPQPAPRSERRKAYNEPHRTPFMRARLVPVLLVLLLAPAARAARTVTVAELEQILAADSGHPDRHVAADLSDLVLTERVSYARLARWKSDFPGEHTQAALLLLADESAFLSLPLSDISSAPPPPLAAQGKMFDRVIDYVNRTMHELPNFIATRTTLHFEDAKRKAARSGSVESGSAIAPTDTPGLPIESLTYLPLRLTGKSTTVVTYRGGEEVQSVSSDRKSYLGLTTRGEFGPILGVVLSDAIHSRIAWGYWQQTAAGDVAVFRYTVPADKSHYLVGFHTSMEPVQSYPAYHGEIAIDPATGSILRISIISEIAPPSQMVGTGILVEYGPVVIGDRTAICPLRSVALSKMPLLPDLVRPLTAGTVLQTRLNDVAFTNYHLFHADVRILSAEEAKRLGVSPH